MAEDARAVIAVVLNRSNAHRVGRCLGAIAQQTRQPDELAVIVAGEAAPDLDAAGLDVPRRSVLSQRKLGGTVGAHNAALSRSRSDFICFLDDHFTPEPAWLDQLLRRLQADGIAGAVSHIVGPGRPAAGAVEHAGLRQELEPATRQLPPVAAMFRREALLRLGGFDPTLPWMAASAELMARVRLGGAQIVREPRAIVVDEGHARLGALVRARYETLVPRAAVEPPVPLMRDVVVALPRRDISRPLDGRITWFLYVAPDAPSMWPADLVRQLLHCATQALRLWRSTRGEAPLDLRSGFAFWLLTYSSAQSLAAFAALWLTWPLDVSRRRRIIRLLPLPPVHAPALIPRRTISACLITQNQERLLPVALESVRDWVDEIVVVDGGSTDRSVEVCRSYGARVIHNPWPGSFAVQRNVYLREARGDWIVMLDSDECFATSAPDAVRRAVAQPKFEHYWVRRQWVVPVGQGFATVVGRSSYPDMLPNLFLRRKAAKYVGSVHTSLQGFGIFMNFAMSISIYHFDFVLNSYEQRCQKVASYEQRSAGAGYPHYYLWENFGYATRPLPWEELPPAAARLLAEYVPKDDQASGSNATGSSDAERRRASAARV